MDDIISNSKQSGSPINEMFSNNQDSSDRLVQSQPPLGSMMEDVDEDEMEISPADRTCELIGDGSQPYALPTMKIKHERFKRIDAATLVKLIDGEYNGLIDSFTIVDCRYPYEYEGGHIIDAVNIHTGPELVRLFIDKKQSHHENHRVISDNGNTAAPLTDLQLDDDDSMQPISSPSSSSPSPPPPPLPTPLITQSQPIISLASANSSSSSSSESMSLIHHHHHHHFTSPTSTSNSHGPRHIIIFHCEFSSERGPRLMKLLREKDRQINKYPELMHPELYLLHGGYREFYKRFKQYCIPQAYKPMNCRNHREELRSYRKRRKVTNPRRKENRTPDISFEG